jgi:hypothetical protein
MAPSAPSTPVHISGRKEPTIFQRYSPHGECPLSFAGSALLHVGLLVAVVVLTFFALNTTAENAKPVAMDVVNVDPEGGGGRLDGVVGGKGLGGKDASSTKIEMAGKGKLGNPRTGDFEVKDVKFFDVKKKDLTVIGETTDPVEGQGDVFDKLDYEQRIGKKIMESDAGSGPPGGSGIGVKGGPASKGAGGGMGGGSGPGSGSAKGPGSGKGPGGPLTDQRRRELRWQILASTNGEVHLKKLQALQVTLLIPLKSQPGFMLRYDLSKPTLVGEKVRAQDDSQKVRWKNANAEEMVTLAQVLNLQEVPPFTVIYLPSGLEADMARRELAYEGRPERDILKTVWDVRERDGAYENEPFIVKQFPRPGAR